MECDVSTELSKYRYNKVAYWFSYTSISINV